VVGKWCYKLAPRPHPAGAAGDPGGESRSMTSAAQRRPVFVVRERAANGVARRHTNRLSKRGRT
jgi:hypothetical protein